MNRLQGLRQCMLIMGLDGIESTSKLAGFEDHNKLTSLSILFIYYYYLLLHEGLEFTHILNQLILVRNF